MRLKRRKRNTFTNLWLMLENMEVVEIPYSSIKKFIYVVKDKCITSMELRVKKGIKLLSFVDDVGYTGFERILSHNDICWIKKYYNGDKQEMLGIRWNNEDDWNSRCQSSYMDGEELVIKIKEERAD